MTSPDEVGRRIKAARIASGLSVKKAAKLADISRETWVKVEAGGSVQDPKRHAALKLLELDDDGLPPSAGADTPVTYENLDPRLNNIERQLDLIWKRLDSIAEEGAEADKDDELARRRRQTEAAEKYLSGEAEKGAARPGTELNTPQVEDPPPEGV